MIKKSSLEDKLLSAHKKLEKKLLISAFKEAQASLAGAKFYGFENIVGVGISEKITGQQNYTGQECVTVYVIKKVSKDQIEKASLVPEKINGVATDVVETGEFNALAFVGRVRPALGGVSIGHFKITAGTLGCLVKRNGQVFILSNNHVLANVNTALDNDPILQPGPYDGGNINTDVIGRFSQFVPINFSGTNLVDCAIAKSAPPLVSPLNKSFGAISGTPTTAQRFMLVKKSGRTTELTRGLVTDVNATVRVGYGTSGQAIFQNQIIVQGIPGIPFSQGGDSGSLILTNTGNNPVALLFAGSNSYTIANPINAVLAALNVSIFTG